MPLRRRSHRLTRGLITNLTSNRQKPIIRTCRITTSQLLSKLQSLRQMHSWMTEQLKDHQLDLAESEWPRVRPTTIQRVEEATDNSSTRAKVDSVAEPQSTLKVHKWMLTQKKRTKCYLRTTLMKSRTTHRTRGRTHRISQMKAKIAKTRIRIWMVI